MVENICTIPINDIFVDTKGCFVCRMYKMVEKRHVEYIMGSAMMSPNVRVVTNKVGFCRRHYDMMSKSGPKLSNALVLQTHLEHIENTLIPLDKAPNKKQLEEIDLLLHSCYVCNKIEHDILHLLSTVFVQYEKDELFRALYNKQDCLCLEHYALVTREAQKKDGISKKISKDFFADTNRLCREYLHTLYGDISHFASMFDYKNRGGDWKNSKGSIERSIYFLTGKPLDNDS